jgi:hypothetical protein
MNKSMLQKYYTTVVFQYVAVMVLREGTLLHGSYHRRYDRNHVDN